MVEGDELKSCASLLELSMHEFLPFGLCGWCMAGEIPFSLLKLLSEEAVSSQWQGVSSPA